MARLDAVREALDTYQSLMLPAHESVRKAHDGLIETARAANAAKDEAIKAADMLAESCTGWQTSRPLAAYRAARAKVQP